MSNKLRKLCVTSVDLVPKGANAEARVALFKMRRENDAPSADSNNLDKLCSLEKRGGESDQQVLLDAALAKVEKLEKALSIEKLVDFAKKYEVLGKKPRELAEKLYEMKSVNTTVFREFVCLLDEQVSLLEKSGVYSQIGSDTTGSGDAYSIISKAAANLRSSNPAMSKEEAFTAACEQNPELLAEYELQLRGV